MNEWMNDVTEQCGGSGVDYCRVEYDGIFIYCALFIGCTHSVAFLIVW